MSEERITRILAGVKKTAQRNGYRESDSVRLKLKKNYDEDKKDGDPTAMGRFLSNIGYNVSCAIMSGRTNQYEETRAVGNRLDYLQGVSKKRGISV